MKYVYLITSPSGKRYVGQSKLPVNKKLKSYRGLAKNVKSNRKIANAIQKYGWDNMQFEIIEQGVDWTAEYLNEREIYWINKYNTLTEGYNMTSGGEGVDPECARRNATKHHANMSDEKKQERAQNCSKGQLKRFRDSPESDVTKKRKSDSHKGEYVIESPDGRTWITDLGLKDFADLHKNEIKISYWQLFGAYRKCYNNTSVHRKRKDNNNWKVTRLDKSDSQRND